MNEVKKYAHIDTSTNKVANISLWDGREYLPQNGIILIQSDSAEVGDDWDAETETIVPISRVSTYVPEEEEE